METLVDLLRDERGTGSCKAACASMEAYDREVGWLGWWSREESNGILAESFEAAILELGC